METYGTHGMILQEVQQVTLILQDMCFLDLLEA